MTQYRQHLPQLEGDLFLTDGGLETTLAFKEGLELPYFAAFHLLQDPAGQAAINRYFSRYMAIARTHGLGFILESATWRASADWGRKLGYSRAALADVNRLAIQMLSALRDKPEYRGLQVVISGCIGPRGDGYRPGQLMSPRQAFDYHLEQVNTFADTAADLVTAMTMTNVPEAAGIARAAAEGGIPSVISFTVETDGRLPAGQTLHEAIEEVDALTGASPAYYMINCAHPLHFNDVLGGGTWIRRLRGIRANASRCSHAELDEAEELDEGNPRELGSQYADLVIRHTALNVLGGCCGTDHRHIEQIARACARVETEYS